MPADKVTKGNIFRVVLSVILGIAGGIVTFFILIFIFLGLGLFGWADGGDPEYLRRLEENTKTTGIISIFVAMIVCITIIIRINKSQPKKAI